MPVVTVAADGTFTAALDGIDVRVHAVSPRRTRTPSEVERVLDADAGERPDPSRWGVAVVRGAPHLVEVNDNRATWYRGGPARRLWGDVAWRVWTSYEGPSAEADAELRVDHGGLGGPQLLSIDRDGPLALHELGQHAHVVDPLGPLPIFEIVEVDATADGTDTRVHIVGFDGDALVALDERASHAPASLR